MPRNLPKKLEGTTTADDIAAMAALATAALAATPVGVPAAIAALVARMSTSIFLLQNIETIRAVTETVAALLEIYQRLRQIGETPGDDRLADSLAQLVELMKCTSTESGERGLACILQAIEERSLQAVDTDETKHTVADLLLKIHTEFGWDAGNGQRLTIAEAVGRLLMTGFYRFPPNS